MKILLFCGAGFQPAAGFSPILGRLKSARRLKPAPLFLLLAVAGALSAQVAQQANTTYHTEEGRKAVATGLIAPTREGTEKPDELIETMGLQPGMTVADVGTGPGFMLPYLSKRVGPGGHVLAEDIFDDFLASAKETVKAHHLTNVTFVKGAETDPKLPAGQVDMELVLDAYHHFDFPEKMLAGLRQALKPDGKLVIVEYYKRESAMPNGRALTHIRLDMPDVIKEVEANHFHLIMEKEHIKDSQYVLVLVKN